MYIPEHQMSMVAVLLVVDGRHMRMVLQRGPVLHSLLWESPNADMAAMHPDNKENVAV